MMYKKMIFLAVAIAGLTMSSCDKDDPTPDNEGKVAFMGGNTLIVSTVKNTDGMSGSSYLQLISDFSGKVDNSKAIQIDFASTVSTSGNEIFTFPGFGKDAVNKVQKYVYKDKKAYTKESLVIPAGMMPNNIVKVNDEKAYMPSYTLGSVWIINPKTMQKIGEIDLTKYAHNDNSPDPSYGIIRDGLYYLPLDQIDAKWMPYADHIQVDVAVIDIKTDKVLKVISEKDSGLSFPTRPMLENMIFMNEQKDIYIACVGYFGYNPMNTKNGFVCIPSGKTEFDTSKSWDISNTLIEGTSYKPAAVYNCKYIGNNKLVAYVGIMELNGNNPYTAKNSMAVLVDLNAKTIKKIDGIPLTDGHSIFIESYKNDIIFGSYGEEKSGFFSYNPNSGEVKLLLETVGNPAYMHVFQ